MGRVKLGDIARECRLTYTGNKSGIPIVGLEHLTPGDIVLHSWDIDTDNTFNKYFKKGQVLLGRRRVYLKKAAVAPFDGICSGDITVIEAIPERLQPELLPFIIQNDRFFEFAIVGSAGSLSPRVKWEYLKDYEIELPDLHKQSELVELLKSANELKHAYQEMLTATDEMVKSQFIEMFSCALQRKLSDVANITMGASPDSNYYNTTNSGLPFYQGKTEFGDMYIGKATLYCSEPIRIAQPNDILMSVRAPVGTVNITKEECCIGRGLASIRPNGVEQLFLYYALKLKEKDLDALGTGTTFKAINKDMLYEFSIEVGTIDKQKAFVEIAQQADKSKYLS